MQMLNEEMARQGIYKDASYNFSAEIYTTNKIVAESNGLSHIYGAYIACELVNAPLE